MRRVIFQADDDLLTKARERANERGVSLAQVVRDALEAELGGEHQAPPRVSIIGIGTSERTDLSELAAADVYQPDPWVSS